MKRKRKKSLFRRFSDNKRYQSISTVLYPLLFGLLIWLLWEEGILNKWFGTDEYTLPSPSKIASIFMDIKDKIIGNVIDTLIVAGLGLLIGSLLGYGIALLAATFPRIGSGGLAIIGAFASIPVVALAPVMTNWTKSVSPEASVRSMVAKIIVVSLIAAANMGLNAYRGLSELPAYSKDLMKTYAAKKRVEIFKLRIPNSIPYIFISLKVSVPASIMTAIVSEYFAEYITGVGRQIRENIVLAQYSTAWAYIAAACMIGIISYALLMIVQAICLKRHH